MLGLNTSIRVSATGKQVVDARSVLCTVLFERQSLANVETQMRLLVSFRAVRDVV